MQIEKVLMDSSRNPLWPLLVFFCGECIITWALNKSNHFYIRIFLLIGFINIFKVKFMDFLVCNMIRLHNFTVFYRVFFMISSLQRFSALQMLLNLLETIRNKHRWENPEEAVVVPVVCCRVFPWETCEVTDTLWTHLAFPHLLHIRVCLNYQKTTLENVSILLQRRLDPVGAEQRSLESRVRGFDVVFVAGLSEPFKCDRFIPQLLSGFEVLMFHLFLSQYGSSFVEVCGEKRRAGESKRERRRDEPARQLLPVFKACLSP